MRRFLLVLGLSLFALGVAVAQRTVSGTVIDETGETLIGVSVLVKGTSTGTVTDIDGNYSLSVPEDNNVLVFSYTGFGREEVNIDNRSVVDLTLKPSAALLEEVIVTAYGVTTKEAFSGSADVVGSQELETRNVTSAIAAIEGNATGVQFTSASDGPGSSPGIVIRGVGTLNGDTDPLFIVDGIQFEGALTNINQEDIESLTVLKDASSTSLYGSRAANGVVLITTKRGSRTGGTRVSASVQHGIVSRAIPLYDEVTPGQYYEAMWEALRNSSAAGGDGAFASANIFNSLGYNPFDVPDDQIVGEDGRLNPAANVVYQSLNWYDELEERNTRTNYNLNVSSGGENHRVFFSTSYLDEGGYIKRSQYDRLTSRANADFDANNWLSLGGSANVTISNTSGPSSAGANNIVNPFGFAKNIGSIYPVYVNDRQGNLVRDAVGDPIFDSGEGFPEFGIGSRPINQGRHALQELLLNDERDRDNTYGFRFYADFKILAGLNFRLNYGRDINEGLEKEYENNIIGDAQPTGRYGETRFRRQVENFNQLLTYQTGLAGGHNLDFTLGHENYDRTYSENDALAVEQTAEGIFEFANFATPVSVGGFTTVKRIEGYFARANYNYDLRYFLSLSARRDGSSVFSDGVRWGSFYSVGASWQIGSESFMDNVSWVDRLKLRASYGEVGNDDLNDFFLSQARYDLTSNAGNPAITASEIGNDLLVWETIESFDVAVEFTLFDNFLDGSLEYYRRNSSDLLYDLPIALSNGYNAFPANVGDMYNAGFELGLTANLITSSDFRWSLRTTASTFQNKITSLPDPFINDNQRWAEGRSRYDFYLLHTAGVDPATGDQLFFQYVFDDTGETVPVLAADGSHAVTNDWQETERAYTGATSIPDLLGSVTTNFFFRGFQLNILFNYGIGGEILDNGYSVMMESDRYGSSLHPDILNAWRQPGDITDVPRLENGNNGLVRNQSTRFLTDASFWALRNVNLSYTLGSRLTDRIGLGNVRISLTGENLYLNAKRDGLNPQYNLVGTSPGDDFSPSRIVSLGVNANF
ncbi:TonB-dependent receptor P39 [Neolewinella maritima]|uniref:TonB-dependent receptor P39 n=1 Tax=Neolewinella maritima TaxID=1383882 RepID=A0ABM9B4S7_9BACT|nr:SusC/RagA family TonB-linked outer membrane protein [Neolewinella maritima]CAH1002356.1 TonB-dependent receptor P39 [Neolewinella maritima]